MSIQLLDHALSKLSSLNKKLNTHCHAKYLQLEIFKYHLHKCTMVNPIWGTFC